MVAGFGSGEQVVVPARPRAPAPGQHPDIGVEHRLVGLIRDRAEDLVLTIAGIAQQRQRLIRMGRQDDLVEALCLTTTRLDQHVIRVARDGIDRRAQPQPLGEGPDQRLDVPSGAPTDRPPGRPVPERQHAVIVEELHQETGGKAPHLARRGRPHRRRLRHDQPLDERPREMVTLQPLSKRDVLGTIAEQLSEPARLNRPRSAIIR